MKKKIQKEKYQVGYGKPPLHSQFKPGQSGNPKGRRKGARGFNAELDEELNQMIQVTENGRPRKIRKQTAMIKSLVAKAMKGDAKSVQLVLGNSNQLRDSNALTGEEADAVDRMILEQYGRRPVAGGKGDSHGGDR